MLWKNMQRLQNKALGSILHADSSAITVLMTLFHFTGHVNVVENLESSIAVVKL